METIKLEKDNILRIGILDENDNDTGEYLEFNLEDTELPLHYKNLIEKDEKNRKWVATQLNEIDNREDIKNGFLSKNAEDRLKVLNEFYKREKEVFDMFLGKGGCDKLLNHKRFGWTSPKKISKIITEQIQPLLDKQMEKITKEVEEMYGGNQEKNVL